MSKLLAALSTITAIANEYFVPSSEVAYFPASLLKYKKSWGLNKSGIFFPPPSSTTNLCISFKCKTSMVSREESQVISITPLSNNSDFKIPGDCDSFINLDLSSFLIIFLSHEDNSLEDYFGELK